MQMPWNSWRMKKTSCSFSLSEKLDGVVAPEELTRSQKKISQTSQKAERERGKTEKRHHSSQYVCPSTSRKSPPQKRGRQSVVSSQLSAMLDRIGLSDRAAVMIVFEPSRALGHDLQALALNRSTIQRQRREHREASSATIKVAFKPNTFNWDAKLMHDLTGIGRLPSLVSTMGDKKLLAVSKIPARTGQAIGHAPYNGMREWGLENLIRSMCFDTTSSNTGQLSGACSIL